MMMRLFIAFSATCALLAQTPAKPPQAPAQDDTGTVIRTTHTVVVAPTTVLDRKGDYVTGLQPSDFTLYDNNKPQRITADVSYEPISLVMAIQASDMLTDVLPKVQRIGNEVTDLIVGAGGEIAVVAFDHRIQLLQDFTDDGGKVSESLKRLKAGSSSHKLNDAVIESVRMLRRRPEVRRRILVVISEKRDQGSSARIKETLTDLEFGNVAVYAIDIPHLETLLTGKAMPPRPDPIPPTAQHMPAGGTATPTMIEQNHTSNFIPMFVEIFKGAKSIFVDDSLDVLTRYTGGKQYSFVKAKTLDRSVEALGQEIHNQYLLSYSPNNQEEGGFHEIRVVVNRPGLEIRTRPGYWVASRPEGQ